MTLVRYPLAIFDMRLSVPYRLRELSMSWIDFGYEAMSFPYKAEFLSYKLLVKFDGSMSMYLIAPPSLAAVLLINELLYISY